MTFTQSVKNQIIKNSRNLAPCCRAVLIGCLIRTTGGIEIDAAGFGFSLSSENIALLKFASAVIEKTFGAECRVTQENGVRLKNRSVYRLSAPSSENILYECGVLSVNGDGNREICETFPRELLADDCCKKTFITSMFRGCGAISLKDGYHCEFSLGNAALAEQLRNMLCECYFCPKVSSRKGETVLYFKGSEQISDLLVYLGATQAVFELQNTIVERSVRNNANRQTNCISANIDKVVEASERQLAAIRTIENGIGLDALPPKLKEAALLRKEYPSASLDELVGVNGSVSKSGLNHRFRKIIETAGLISEKNKD